MSKPLRFIISGGGTGGHIFPAIAIGQALQKSCNAELLFVGAEGRMEMTRVPEAGYKIQALPIRGLQRSLSLDNLQLPVLLWRSLRKSSKIIRDFKPDAVIGVGGYASGPLLIAAQWKGVPTFIQEQNAFAGLTNRLLAPQVRRAYVAFEGLEQVFGARKTLITGNPIRNDLRPASPDLKNEAFAYFKLNPYKPVLLITGGSLGAGTLNRATKANLDLLENAGIQIIWQTGRSLAPETDQLNAPGRFVSPFIQRMDLAYAAATLVLCRAGASTLSELATVKKAAILVPAPMVAEDHQRINAHAFVKKGAARMLPDEQAQARAIPLAIELIQHPVWIKEMEDNLEFFDRSEAATAIATDLIQLLQS